jgi:hypothetical protein
MKKIFCLFIIVILTTLVSVPSVNAQKPTEAQDKPGTSVTPSESVGQKFNEQINQLKEKIASRVAELNLVEKRGIIGTVSEVSGNKITLIDKSNKTRFIDVDEITKFSSAEDKKSFGLSDLTKGTKISVLGLYNKDSKRILARFINTSVNPTIISGAVSEKDKVNYTFTTLTENQKQTKIDVGTSTKISAYNKDDGLSKYGFSKLAVGDRIVIIGYPDKKDSSLTLADRIVVLTDVPKNPKIVVSQPSEEISPEPSTTNKKPTPIEK